MGYERIYERRQQSTCACGKGRVVRTYYESMNDWNQTIDGYEEEKIECDECKAQYHIETLPRTYYLPKWVGASISTDVYLVPKGETLNQSCKYRDIHLFNFEELCVAEYPIEKIRVVIEDMQKSKFTTRLTLSDSKEIVSKFYSKYRRKKLSDIVIALQKCVDSYYNHEWTYEKMCQYQRLQREEKENNECILQTVLAKSFPLDFH